MAIHAPDQINIDPYLLLTSMGGLLFNYFVGPDGHSFGHYNFFRKVFLGSNSKRERFNTGISDAIVSSAGSFQASKMLSILKCNFLHVTYSNIIKNDDYDDFFDAWKDLAPGPFKNDLPRALRVEKLLKINSTFPIFRQAGNLNSQNSFGSLQDESRL